MAKHKHNELGVLRPYDFLRPEVKFSYLLIILLLIVALLICLMPFVWVLLAGFKDQREFIRGVRTALPDGSVRYLPRLFPTDFDLSHYVKTWNDTRFYRYYLNSLIVVAGSAISALVFNGLLAYGLAILKPRGHNLVLGLVMASLMLPATTSMAPLFVNINRIGLSGSFWPLMLGVGASAFYVVLFRNFFLALPTSLTEAARLDGCGDWQLFFKIIFPLSMPINMVVLIYAINGAWSDFLLPYLVLNNAKWAGGFTKETVMVRLFSYQSSSQSMDIDIIRAIVFSIIPPILLFILFQRRITDNVVSAGIKG